MKVKQKPSTGLIQRVLQKIPARLPLLFLLALIAVIVTLSGTIKAEKTRLLAEKKEAITKDRPPANVVLLKVSPATMLDRINLPGIIEPWEKLKVMSKLHGTVVDVMVKEGDKVEQGQVIAHLDPADFRIARDSAKASFELATADQQRLATLFNQGIISQSEIEKRDAQVKTSKAVLENAELMLSRCAITAPIHGVIRRMDAKEGLLLNISDPVAEILQIDKVKAVIGIPESDVALARDITEVSITVQALNNKKVVGQTHYLASSPENGARLYRLELAIDNADNTILPGMFFRAEIIKKIYKDTIAVPLYTVIKRQDQQFVFVEENGIATQLPVKLGIIEDWQVQIISGLSLGSRVVIEGHRDIDQGHKLNIVKVINDPREALL